MIILLADHNLEGQASILWEVMEAGGWTSLLSLQLRFFGEIELPEETPDREVWRLVQSRGMVLLTANRNMDKADSLERAIREENSPTALPVITIGDAQRLTQRAYRERCASRLVEILFDLDDYRGAGRLFIP